MNSWRLQKANKISFHNKRYRIKKWRLRILQRVSPSAVMQTAIETPSHWKPPDRCFPQTDWNLCPRDRKTDNQRINHKSCQIGFNWSSLEVPLKLPSLSLFYYAVNSKCLIPESFITSANAQTRKNHSFLSSGSAKWNRVRKVEPLLTLELFNHRNVITHTGHNNKMAS